MSNYGSVKIISSSYVATPQDDVIGVMTERSACFITLPSINSLPIGKIYIIKDIANSASINNITIGTQDRTSIDNQSSATISANGGSLTLIFTISGWSVTSQADIPDDIFGDVTGPASSSNGGLSIFSGTTGKLLQNCTITVDSSNNILGIGNINGVNISTLTSSINSLVTKTSRYFDVVSDFGADPTGVSDCLSAFNAALTAATFSKHYVEIVVPVGQYRFSSSLTINTRINIKGSGTSYTYGSTLLFPAGQTGLELAFSGGPTPGGAQNISIQDLAVASIASVGQWVNGQACVPGNTYKRSNIAGGYQGLVYVCSATGSSGSIEPVWPTSEGLFITTNGGAQFVTRYVAGVKIRTSVNLERMSASAFGGDGISVYASTGDGDNANSCTIVRCKTDSNIGWGFYTQGADSNACAFMSCIATGNGQVNLTGSGGGTGEIGTGYGGFCDNSFVGNSYFACTSEGNYGFGYLVPRNQFSGGLVNESRFYGCYSEGGQHNDLNQKSMWVAGTVGAAVVPGTYALSGVGIQLSYERSNTMYFQNDTIGNGTGETSYLRCGRILTQVPLEVGFSQDSNRPLQLIYGQVSNGSITGWVSYLYNGTISPLGMSLSNSSEGAGHTWIPNNFYRGTPGNRVKETTVNGAPPSTGSWVAGDTAIEVSPQISGIYKWQCIVAGTPGIWVPVTNGTRKNFTVTTSTLTLTQGNTGTLYINSITSTLTLPTAPIVGTTFDFSCLDARGFTISAASSNVIYLGAQATSTAGFIQSLTVGSTIKLTFMKTNTWVSESSSGTWTIGP